MKRSISHFFIERPAFAMVISIVITIIGIVGYCRLPVAQYPNVVPPSVVVRTSYPGAYRQPRLGVRAHYQHAGTLRKAFGI